ncbi:MAG: GHMP kinase [Kiritimatiellae bacterium]|nr:GHMP kinase [Kiritimatiellia bacterium]
MAETDRRSASAPGSLMLLGEHAVLDGHPAVVAAINQRITVHVSRRADRDVGIVSGLGVFEGSLDALSRDPRFRFVHASLNRFWPNLDTGILVEIESPLSATKGFGTSAAVTVALMSALRSLAAITLPHREQLQEALSVIHAVQGRGSGADAAASLLGGIVEHRTAPLAARVLNRDPLALTAVYCGYKTPTPEVIRLVQERFAERPADKAALFQAMGALASEGAKAFADKDLAAAGACMRQSQTILDALGLSTPELADILRLLEQSSAIDGAKISGSGLGDCAVGLGHTAGGVNGFETYHLEVDPKGCRDETA